MGRLPTTKCTYLPTYLLLSDVVYTLLDQGSYFFKC